MAVLIGINRIGDGHILRGFFAGPEMHQNFIFNTPRRIGSQTDALCIIKGTHRLNQPDGADGNQVVLVAHRGVVFFYDVCHQPEIVLNKLISRLHVAILPVCLQAGAFLLGAEWTGK